MRTVVTVAFVVACGLAAADAPVYCQTCNAYSFDVPEGAAGAAAEFAGEFFGFTPGDLDICEQLRGKIQAAQERRVRRARDTAQQATARRLDVVSVMYDSKLSSEQKRAKLDAASADAEKAEANLRAAQQGQSQFPRRCNCVAYGNRPATPDAERSTRVTPKPVAPEPARSKTEPRSEPKPREARGTPRGASPPAVSPQTPPPPRRPDDLQTADAEARARRNAELRQGQDALNAMVDPKTGKPVQLAPVDAPFVNPLGPRVADSNSAREPARGGSPSVAELKRKEQRDKLTAALPGARTAADEALTLIQRLRVEAPRSLTGTQLRQFSVTADNVELAVKGLKKYLSASNYALLLGQISESDGNERREKTGEFLVEGTKDLAELGFAKYGARLLGAEATAVLQGAARFAGSVGSIFVTTSTHRDPQEILRDPRTSVGERQKAVGDLWRSYERWGITNWSEAQKEELIYYSALVYSQAKRLEPPTSLGPR